MKKKIITIVFVFLSALGYSQNSKGTYLLGITDDITSASLLEMSIMPSFAYFVKDGIAVGSGLSYSSALNYIAAPDYSLLISPFIRNYISKDCYLVIGGEVAQEQRLVASRTKYLLGSLGVRMGVGYSFMFNDKLSLEPALLFKSAGLSSSYLGQNNDLSWPMAEYEFTGAVNSIEFNLGVSVRF